MKALLMQQVDLPGLEEIVFTKTQTRLLTLLSDGVPHAKQEMRDCLYDDMGALSNVHFHVTCIRKKIRPAGYRIMIQFQGRTPLYCLVKAIS